MPLLVIALVLGLGFGAGHASKKNTVYVVEKCDGEIIEIRRAKKSEVKEIRMTRDIWGDIDGIEEVGK